MLPSVSQSLLYISFCKKRHIVAAILFQILRIPSIKPNIRNRQNFKIVKTRKNTFFVTAK